MELGWMGDVGSARLAPILFEEDLYSDTCVGYWQSRQSLRLSWMDRCFDVKSAIEMCKARLQKSIRLQVQRRFPSLSYLVRCAAGISGLYSCYGSIEITQKAVTCFTRLEWPAKALLKEGPTFHGYWSSRRLDGSWRIQLGGSYYDVERMAIVPSG
jgi:hypothetical protein